MKKCIIYASVDKSREIDMNECPYCQVSRLRKIARKKNLKVDLVRTDYCSKINQKKPILNQLLRDATNGKIQTILVQDYTRMAGSVSEWLVIKKLLTKQGVNIITAEMDSDDSSEVHGELAEKIFSIVNLYDNELHSKRIKRGITNRKAKQNQKEMLIRVSAANIHHRRQKKLKKL